MPIADNPAIPGMQFGHPVRLLNFPTLSHNCWRQRALGKQGWSPRSAFPEPASLEIFLHFTSRGQVRPLEVISMFPRLSTCLMAFTLLVSIAAHTNLLRQEPSAGPLSGAAPSTQATANSSTPAPNCDQIAVPTGTRLPLLLRNGINTRTAKAGDS